MVTYMKVLEAYTNSVYENFRTQDYDYWSFGNQILYDMCLKNPSHTNENVIIGKIWLIGRSYAAAIERIKEKSVPSDDFYSDVVAPHFLQFGVELDDKLKYLKSTTEVSLDNLQEILYVHKFLVNQITEITKLEKHSLASILSIPSPSSVTIISSIPALRSSITILLAPASIEFSVSSLTIEASFSITSPAAILFAKLSLITFILLI